MSDATTPSPMPQGGDFAMSAALAKNWWAVALRGVLAVIFGLIAIATPGVTLLSLALFFGVYLLIDGVFGIVAAIRAARRDERWGLLLAEGVLDIVMGLIAVAFPVGAVLAFVLATAAWSLVTGVLMLMSAFKLTAEHGRWWMVLGGVASLLFGVALAVSPVIGAVVLTWWLGAYALAFGAFLLVLAFRLRAKHQESPGAGTPAASAT